MKNKEKWINKKTKFDFKTVINIMSYTIHLFLAFVFFIVPIKGLQLTQEMGLNNTGFELIWMIIMFTVMFQGIDLLNTTIDLITEESDCTHCKCDCEVIKK